jgi:PAS domain S-box-containing protein
MHDCKETEQELERLREKVWELEQREILVDQQLQALADVSASDASCIAEILQKNSGLEKTCEVLQHDILARKRAQEVVGEIQESYRNLYNNAPVAMFTTDEEGTRAIAVNYASARMFGYPSQEAFLAEFVPIEHYVDESALEHLAHQLIEKGEVENHQCELKRRDGSTFWAEFYAKAWPERGSIDFVSVDITDRKCADEELTRYSAELEYKNLELEEARTELALANRDLKQEVTKRTAQVQDLLKKNDEFLNRVAVRNGADKPAVDISVGGLNGD